MSTEKDTVSVEGVWVWKKGRPTLVPPEDVVPGYVVADQSPEAIQRFTARADVRELREAAARVVVTSAIPALDAITEQPSRSVLDLHKRVAATDGDWLCDICGGDVPDDWPCATVRVIAAHHGIEMPT